MLSGDEPYPHLHPYNRKSEVSIHSSSEAEPGLVMIVAKPGILYRYSFIRSEASHWICWVFLMSLSNLT